MLFCFSLSGSHRHDACVRALGLEPSCTSQKAISIDFASSGAHAASFGSNEDFDEPEATFDRRHTASEVVLRPLRISTWFFCLERWMSLLYDELTQGKALS